MRPKVTLENVDAVYDYYLRHRPNKYANRLGHWAMSQVFKPQVSFADGAEERIGEALEAGTRILLSSNHLNANDQYIVASMARREQVLRPMIGNTFIPAKQPLFKNPLLRLAVDTMDAQPTFRIKDLAGVNEGVSETKVQQRAIANKLLLETSIARINSGYNMAIFPEGTRNEGEDADPLLVQSLARGIGTMACGLSDEVNYAVVPMGIFYGHNGIYEPNRKPFVHIGNPLTERFGTPDLLLEALHPAMQACVDQAVAASYTKAA